jgi:hypothetical protein
MPLGQVRSGDGDVIADVWVPSSLRPKDLLTRRIEIVGEERMPRVVAAYTLPNTKQGNRKRVRLRLRYGGRVGGMHGAHQTTAR